MSFLLAISGKNDTAGDPFIFYNEFFEVVGNLRIWFGILWLTVRSRYLPPSALYSPRFATFLVPVPYTRRPGIFRPGLTRTHLLVLVG